MFQTNLVQTILLVIFLTLHLYLEFLLDQTPDLKLYFSFRSDSTDSASYAIPVSLYLLSASSII